ncbi:hypothetical protein EKO04_008126 [Ascochyta lentis]|uniref:Uncharacterized protein n=1 Tax=Ascochyta lentis TaxID=205686 RepID=A0A8H7IWX5_9PLEO|nr:hypothetical protein EKO04_008126 [Ascochyta lentis]
MLLQAALEPLLTVYDVLEPYINDLRQGCEDDAYGEDIKQMKLTLEQSVIGPIMGLTTQVSELVRGINTLLLLFIIDGNITTRPHSVSVHHLTEMQALKLRAKITELPELDRMAQPYTPKTLSNEQEQQSLKTTRKKVEDHWDIVQVAIHGIWKNAALSETAGMPGHSLQSSAHRTPSGPSTHASSVKPTTNSSAAKATASNTKMRPAGLF